MFDGMTDEEEYNQRFWERLGNYEGTRKLPVITEREYGITSITRKQQQYCQITYIVRYKDIASGKIVEFVWNVPNNMEYDRHNYQTLEEQLGDTDRDTDCIEKLQNHGFSQGLTYVLHTRFHNDLEYANVRKYREKMYERYNDEWRANEKHPEYGPNGENALAAIIASDALDDDPSKILPQRAVLLTRSTIYLC